MMCHAYPIGSMYALYTNIGGILMGSMLPYIAAPWILWDMDTIHKATGWGPRISRCPGAQTFDAQWIRLLQVTCRFS